MLVSCQNDLWSLFKSCKEDYILERWIVKLCKTCIIDGKGYINKKGSLTKNLRCNSASLNIFYELNSILTLRLAKLSNLEFLKNLCCRENARVNDTRNGECSSNDGANCRQKVVERWPALMIPHCYRVQVILEPQSWDDSSSMTKWNVAPVSVSVLISY